MTASSSSGLSARAGKFSCLSPSVCLPSGCCPSWILRSSSSSSFRTCCRNSSSLCRLLNRRRDRTLPAVLGLSSSEPLSLDERSRPGENGSFVCTPLLYVMISFLAGSLRISYSVLNGANVSCCGAPGGLVPSSGSCVSPAGVSAVSPTRAGLA